MPTRTSWPQPSYSLCRQLMHSFPSSAAVKSNGHAAPSPQPPAINARRHRRCDLPWRLGCIDCDVKLGTNPGDERLAGPKYRYIDFEGAAKMKVGAHRYFVADPGKKLSKEANKLFQRVFSSQEDFSADETPRVVYPVGCSENGSVCYMGNSSTPNGSL